MSTQQFIQPITKLFKVATVPIVLLLLLIPASAVYANTYQDKIDTLDSKISSSETIIKELQSRADSLQNKLKILAAEKSQIQSKINQGDAKREKLIVQIAENERKIETQQAVLGDTLADLYVGEAVSPIEMLASSQNIGDYLDQAEYQSSIRDNFQDSIEQIKVLKEKLDTQKSEVEGVIAKQKGQRSQLADKQREQKLFLAQTKGEEKAYKSLVSDLKGKREVAEAALASTLASGDFSVSPEGYVKAGEVVGAVGNSGFSTANHLHLEARKGGALRNPNDFMQAQPTTPPIVTQGYQALSSDYISGRHPGIDYGPAGGAPIYAISSGTLYRGCSNTVLNTSNNEYGYVSIVDQGNGVRIIYAHMSGGPSACNYNTYY